MHLPKILLYRKRFVVICLFLLILSTVQITSAQDIVINELMSSNSSTLTDEDGQSPDWIELFNAGDSVIDLEGFNISDSSNLDQPWIFPAMTMSPGEYLLLFASGKDKREVPLKWETVIDWGDEWNYLVPESDMPSEWNTLAFDDSSWDKGESGFGYGDDDDNTIIDDVLSVYIRKEFTVNDPSDVLEMLLHMDYDDAFVAYINGVEVARENITSEGSPAFDHPADNYDHEAKMYLGGLPDRFVIQDIDELLLAGSNVLAIQIHNHTTESSDLTAIPFLSLGRTKDSGGGISAHLDLNTKNLHSNFKLSSEGEFLLLYDPSGNLVDSVFTRTLPSDVSLGKQPDGTGEWRYFDEPTPRRINSSQGFTSKSGEVTYTRLGGHYNGSFQLEITSDDPADQIYYTTDGSTPKISGSLYTVPISINKTTVVRAQIVNNTGLPGEIGTQTYLLSADHELPVISIATDPANLWDYDKGIYVKGPNAEPDLPYFGANFWQDWEKPIHIEMYEPDGSLAFSQNAGTKIFGGWSRANDQKSLSIFARKSYGKGVIDYQIFPQLGRDKFPNIVLRNSGNDWNTTMFRDALLTSLFHEEVDKQAYRPAVIYINGKYWGIQNIREKVNEDFLASHHNLNPDSITILQGYAETVEGSGDEYRALSEFVHANDLSDESNYQYVKERVDLFNFMQYQIGNIYVDNKDWPGNNNKYWKTNKPGSKWRWITYDTDFGFDIWNEGFVNYNTLQFALNPNGPDWPNPPWSTLFLRKLIENDQFKNAFINAFSDRLNSALLPANVIAKIEDLRAGIESEIEDHMDKWNGDMGYWEQSISRMQYFANNRPAHVRQHIRSAFRLSSDQQIILQVNDEAFGAIRINTITPVGYPWEGTYFQGVPVELEAVPQPGYTFLRWEGDISQTTSTVSINLDKKTTVKAVFEESDPELNSIVINEINYNSSSNFDTEDWVELYNKGEKAIDMSGWVLKDDDDTHEFVFSEGTILESGEFLVVCRDQEAFSALISEMPIAGDMSFGLSGSGDCVRLFNDQTVLTDEVCYLPANPWPSLQKNATLALKNPRLNNSDPENWYSLEGNGNPGEGNELEPSFLAIPEDPELSLSVYPNPSAGIFPTIVYAIRKTGVIRLNLYNPEGKFIKTLYEGMSSAGAGEYHMSDTPEMAPGVYFIGLEVGSGRTMVRFIIN